jgi:hypothetical protein
VKSVCVSKGSTASFSIRISQPRKIILYGAGPNLKTSTTTVCLKGTKVSTVGRGFATAGTRNMLHHIRGKQDVCYAAVANAESSVSGRLGVDVYPR